ncbi:MAG: hypothetical protein HQK86_01200 [Nitrospinae bacterium]|nr:hypothetical protein [Nitrospinota bacterium]MBF0633800.1 hypothetical protein [Nitrospinota bacterium]
MTGSTSNSNIPYRLMLAVFVITMLAYVGLELATFTPPSSAEAAKKCGLAGEDLDAIAEIQSMTPTQMWWTGFVNTQEYWNVVSAGLAGAFIAFGFSAARRVGAGVASGAVVGGGVLAFLTICLGCLAPVLSVVGIGIGGSMLADIPKWLMTLNTLLLTGGGTMFLSRKLTSCPVLPTQCCLKTTGNQTGETEKLAQK